MQRTGIAMPLLIALLPLTGMAVLQFILPVLGPLLTAEAQYPPEAYGWLGGALGLGSITFLLTCHAILPCFGPVRTLRLGLTIAIAGIGLVLTGIWPLMIGGAFLIGYGYATTTPSGSQVLADFTPRAIWGTLFSIRIAAVPVGGIIAGLLGIWVATDYGWRQALSPVIIICGIAGIFLLAIPVRFNESRPLRPFLAARLFEPGSLRRPWVSLNSIPGLPTLALGSWCMSCVHAVVTSFFVIYLHAGLKLPLDQAAFLFALLQGFAIAGRILFGALADRLGSPLPVLRLLAPLSGTAAVLLSFMTADWSSLAMGASAIMIGLTVGSWNGLYLAEIARLAPPAEVGEATASSAFFGFTAYLLAPPAAGAAFMAIGYPATFRVVALLAFAAMAIFVLRERAPRAWPDRPTPLAGAFAAGFVIMLSAAGIVVRGPLPEDARAAPVMATLTPKGANFSSLFTHGLLVPASGQLSNMTARAALQRADDLLARPTMTVAEAQAATHWLKHGLSQGGSLPPAVLGWGLTQLGSLYAQPRDGRQPDYVAARHVWEIAGLMGDPIARCFDARLSAHGLGVPVDLTHARRRMAQARERGGCPGHDTVH